MVESFPLVLAVILILPPACSNLVGISIGEISFVLDYQGQVENTSASTDGSLNVLSFISVSRLWPRIVKERDKGAIVGEREREGGMELTWTALLLIGTLVDLTWPCGSEGEVPIAPLLG